MRERSGEAIIGTDVGVTKSRTIRRKGSHEERWSVTLFESMRGVPWSVVPGKGMSSIPVNIGMPESTPDDKSPDHQDAAASED